MKTIIFYGFALTLAIFIAYIIINQEEKPSAKVLTVDTTYTYLYKESQKLSFSIYMNTSKHPLLMIDLHEETMIHNEDESKRLSLNLLSIEDQDYDVYLNETYQEVIFSFEFPYLGNDFEIEDCYITFTLENGLNYLYYLGDLYLSYQVQDESYLHWDELYAVKKENSYLSRIYQIYLPHQGLDEVIDSISIGSHDVLSFEVEEHQLIITIEEENKLLYQVPLIITYQNGFVQTIDNFRYIIDYQILKESGPLIHAYALD